jgi:hypothetical protein
MADKFIDIDIENEHEVIRHLERVEEHNQRRAREVIEELSKFTENMLTITVPTYNLYIFRHIDRSGPTWMPGGAGGGGEWKAIVGIKEGDSRHPLYVEFGTGIYGNKGDLIWASGVKGLTGRYQKVMTFEKRGEGRKFRYWIRGQKPQRYMYLTWGVLNALAQERMAEIRLFD